MKNTKKFALLLTSLCLAAGCVVGAVACDTANDTNPNPPSGVTDTSGEMYFETTEYEITLNETIALKLVNGGNGVVWSAVEEGVVTIDASGIVTPVAIGETIIKATKGNEVAMCRVVVITARAESALSLTLNKTSLKLYEGSGYSLQAMVREGSAAVDATIRFQSLNTQVASVTEEGIVTAKGAGETYVKVVASYGGKTVEKWVLINVLTAKSLLSINITSTQLHKDATMPLVASVTKGAQVVESDADVAYSVSDDTIATVVSGELVGLKKGYVTVLASYEYEGETLQASAVIRVRETYVIEWMSDGEMYARQELLDGETIKNSVEKPSVVGQRFLYWTYEGQQYSFGDAIEQDMCFVAKWNPYDFAQSFYGAQLLDEKGEEMVGAVSKAERHEDGIRYTFPSANAAFTVSLPLINYAKHEKVAFEWSVDGWTQFGQGEDRWFYDQAALMRGTILITPNAAEGKLLFEVTDGGSKHSKVIADAAIVNGEKALTLSIYAFVAGRNFEMSAINCDEDAVLPEPPPSVATTETYIRDYRGNEYDASVENGVYTYKVNSSHASEEDGIFAALTLPKNDYTQNPMVSFNWYVSGWAQFGHGRDLWFYDRGTAMNGTATVVYANGELTLTMVRDNGKTYGKTIADADAIIAGEESFALNFIAYSNQVITISNLVAGDIGDIPMPDTPTPDTPTPDTPPVETESETYVCDKDGNKYDAAVENGVYTYYIQQGYGDSDAQQFGYITLPKIDYTQHTQVTLKWKTSGYTMIGQGKELWFYAEGEQTGTLTLTYDGTSLQFAMSKDGGATYTLTFTDSAIIHGEASMTLGFFNFAYQMITISDITLGTAGEGGETPDTPPVETESETYVCDKDGNKYDAAVENGVYTYYIQQGYGDSDAQQFGYITLPKIDYTQHTQVTLKWKTSGYTMIGQGKELWFYEAGEQTGTLTLTYDGTSLQFAMSKDGGATYTLTFTDSAIIQGEASMTLGFFNFAAQRITISDITLGTAGEGGETPDTPPVEMESETYVCDYQGGKAEASVSNGTYTYRIAQAHGDKDSQQFGYITIPKIDFREHTTVTLDFYVSGWTMIGYDIHLWFYQQGAQTGTLTLTYADGVLTFTMVVNGVEHSMSIRDEAIINGEKSVAISFYTYSNQTITISNIVY